MSHSEALDLIIPDWPAPARVKAFISTRCGGVSQPPFDKGNLADHVEDSELSVSANRVLLKGQVGVSAVQWLEQVHGVKVVQAQRDDLVRTADACYTREADLACAVLTADCLPVLLCDKSGTQVAAVHAGWRSLAGGIISRTVKLFDCDYDEVLVYLGPAISQSNFEVGIDVLETFFESAKDAEHCEKISAAFNASPTKPMHFCADLYALAQAELNALGVSQVYGGNYCTYDERERFYSYRREGRTGRMVSLIALT
jgi:YfiH family protein